jgi:hypothetical protein
MGVTNPLTATYVFAIYSLLIVLQAPKELSNQPLSHVHAPSPVQL